MGTDGEFDTSKVAVKTYVPAYQRDTWEEHADQLGMSRSEFVRTMVQAGRRNFEVEEGHSDGANPGGRSLETRIQTLLETEGPLDWDELVDALAEDIEDRLDDALESLQERNEIRYSGRDGGYARSGGGS